MLYRVLADIVVAVHLLWILFLFTGAYWGRRSRTIMYVHAGGLGFAMVSQIFGWYCPLTHVEVWLRAKEDPAQTYPGSFIIHYAENLIYIEVTPAIIFTVTLILAGVNGWVYWKALKKRTD